MNRANRPIKSMFAASLRRQRFVDAYCGTCRMNASAAARVAGYKGTGKVIASRGSELLAHRDVQMAVRERMLEAHTKAIAEAREILEMLTRHLRGNMGDFLSDGGAIDLKKARIAGKLGLIKRLRQTKVEGIDPKSGVPTRTVTTMIELHDVQAAASMLLKARGAIGKEEVRVVGGDREHIDVLRQRLISRYLALGVPIERWPIKLQQFYRSSQAKPAQKAAE